jgi:hypothetical protein
MFVRYANLSKKKASKETFFNAFIIFNTHPRSKDNLRP